MRFGTFVIIGVCGVLLGGAFLQAQSAIEIRAASSTAVDGWQRVTVGGGEALWVSPVTSLTSADVATSRLETGPDGRAAVGVVFTADGARRMRELSAARTNQRIALLLDGTVIWAPVVRSTIAQEATLTGLSPDQAKRLMASLPR